VIDDLHQEANPLTPAEGDQGSRTRDWSAGQAVVRAEWGQIVEKLRQGGIDGHPKDPLRGAPWGLGRERVWRCHGGRLRVLGRRRSPSAERFQINWLEYDCSIGLIKNW
jgi:hypothetical protein